MSLWCPAGVDWVVLGELGNRVCAAGVHLVGLSYCSATDQEMLLTEFINWLCLYLERFAFLECNQLNAFQQHQVHHTFSLFTNRRMKEDFYHVPPCPSLRLLNELIPPFFTPMSKSYKFILIL